MFKMLTWANGRSVYAGKIKKISTDRKALVLAGTEYDRNTKTQVEKEILAKAIIPDDVAKGDCCMLNFLPSEKDDTKGKASTMGFSFQGGKILSGTIEIKSGKNAGKKAEQAVIMASVRKKKWNEKKTVLNISFINLRDEEGNLVGNPSSWVNQYSGETLTSYWFNVTSFSNKEDSAYRNFFDAVNFDRNVGEGDTVVCVVRKSENTYKEKVYINYNLSSFFVIKRKEGQPSQNSYATSEPVTQEQTEKKTEQVSSTAATASDLTDTDFEFMDNDDDLPFV